MNQNKWGLTAFHLKLLAIVTMLIDHIGYVFYWGLGQWSTYFRIVGRLAFPIFCFLLVEGFVHTRSRRNYVLRLALFALISEPFFDLAFHRAWYWPGSQNVFFTLLIGFLVLWALEYFERNLIGWLLCLLGCLVAQRLHTDYRYIGVLFILVFYLLRNRRGMAMLAMCLVDLLAGNRLETALMWIQQTHSLSCLRYFPLEFRIQDAAVLAIFPILLYNGEKGRGMKWFFYVFYPAHLLLLYVAATYVM